MIIAIDGPSVQLGAHQLQALAMVRSGLTLPPEQLALVCASHNGEKVHLDTARAILATAGLDESALRNTASWPLHEKSQHAAIHDDVPKSSLQMNCSGKHSGMVVTCAVNHWNMDDYLHPDHPLQQRITETIPDVAGEEAFVVHVEADAVVLTVRSLTRARHTCRPRALNTATVCPSRMPRGWASCG
mgnify:CR=1 FL=1